MKEVSQKVEQSPESDNESSPVRCYIFYVLFFFFIPFTLISASSSRSGLSIPGLDWGFVLSSGNYYTLLAMSYIYAVGLLTILRFLRSLNRLIVALMIVVPLGVIHVSRWYALLHFPEVRPM